MRTTFKNKQICTIIAQLPCFIMALSAWAVYESIVSDYSNILPQAAINTYPYLSFYFLAACALMALYLIDTALVRKNNRLVGHVSKRQFMRFSLLVVSVYGIMYLLTVSSVVDMEPSMRQIHLYFDFLPVGGVLIESLSLILLAPIVEEVLYRHFLLGAIGLRAPYSLQVFMVVMVSILFSAQHVQYENVTTYCQIFLLGAIFGYARITSGGLALPLFLHSLAIALGLLLNEIYVSIGL